MVLARAVDRFAAKLSIQRPRDINKPIKHIALRTLGSAGGTLGTPGRSNKQTTTNTVNKQNNKKQIKKKGIKECQFF